MSKGQKIRVGIIGANPDKGWGSSVHIPAIQMVPDYELVAVCTTRTETAEASAKAFGARLAFTNAAELAQHPEVDVVTVCVKAPDHHAAALPALQAGKHVVCEWPLAANTAQADEMLALATQNRLHTAVGLQARMAPPLAYLRDLLAQGYVGRVVAAHMVCNLPGGGARRSREGLYVIHKENGATTLSIQGGHAIDAFRYCLGEFADVSAVVENMYPTITVIETGEEMAKSAPDQALVSGRLKSGAVAAIHINGGVVAGHGVSLTVYGENGTLSVVGQSPYNFQMANLTLWGAQKPERTLAPLPIPATYERVKIPADFKGRPPYPGVEIPRATVQNVAGLYAAFAQTLRSGQGSAPDFATGRSLHRLLDKLEYAAETGQRQALENS